MSDRPVRSCVACRTRRPQADLIRVAIAPDGSIGLDTGSDRQGRGAYVCPDPRCISKAVGQGAFVRRLKGGSIREGLEKSLLEEVQKAKKKEADG